MITIFQKFLVLMSYIELYMSVLRLHDMYNYDLKKIIRFTIDDNMCYMKNLWTQFIFIILS